MAQEIQQLRPLERLDDNSTALQDAPGESSLAEDLSGEIESTIGLSSRPAENRDVAKEQGGGKRSAKKDDGDDGKAKKKAYQKKRQQLINSNPKESVMIQEIRVALHKKLIGLEKEEYKIRRQGLKAIDSYVDVIAKIRHIKRMFSQVASAGYKALKAIWLKVVHGIV